MKLVIVYHGYMYGDAYIGMMTEQFRLLLNTGLFSIADHMYVGINVDPKAKPIFGEEWIRRFWSFSSSKEQESSNKVEIVVYTDNKEETRTLEWIRDYAKENPDDYILYFHSKGITKKNQATEDWRKYMEYFVIEHWGSCLTKLTEGYDCCGVLWNTDTVFGDFPHFSGGMWWAKASYINRLQHDYLYHPLRYFREFWIGSGKDVKVFEFHNSRLNDKASLLTTEGHYRVLYPRAMYDK